MKKLIAVLILMVIILTAAVGYLAGKSQIVKLPKINIAVDNPSPSPPIASPETEKPRKVVLGGGVLSFPKYLLTVPLDWADSKQVLGPDAEKVTVKKGDYEISITQGGFGGATCLYPGDPDSEGPSSRYTSFIEIVTNSGDLFRRSWSGTTTAFAICQRTEYGWGAPTLYGSISFKVPAGYTTEMIAEMDAILASLAKR